MRNPPSWRGSAVRAFPGARFDEPMRRHTTFRIGGPADCYVEVPDERGLRRAVRFCLTNGLPLFLLGWGSKLLVADSGIRGLVVRLAGAFERAGFLRGGRLKAGAGARLPKLVSLAARAGWAGLEPLAGIPGTVGGALVMNAGTADGSIGDLVRYVRVLDPAGGEFRTLVRGRGRGRSPSAPTALGDGVGGRGQVRFGYRTSSLAARVVVGCELQLKACAKDDIITRIREYQRRRSLTQPIHSQNIGSIFKNPPGFPAAKLIEDCGLKGAVCGGARVSTKHANFIENFSQASAADVLELVGRIRDRVRAAHGVDLELEMRVVGDASV